jgi:hypothetical protein
MQERGAGQARRASASWSAGAGFTACVPGLTFYCPHEISNVPKHVPKTIQAHLTHRGTILARDVGTYLL